MSMKPMIAALALGVGLSACSVAELATRNKTVDALPQGSAAQSGGYTQADTIRSPMVAGRTMPGQQTAEFQRMAKGKQVEEGKSLVTVNKVIVEVPDELTVNEMNTYLPKGDIVWREDPLGDRRAQVKAIVEDAMKKGVEPLDGPVSVDIRVQVKRFHALTQKARYTTGGVHGLSFLLGIYDAKTGRLIVPVREVRADFEAYGGRKALEAEARGQTQKVRITDHLAEVIGWELIDPDNYKNPSLGLIQVLNYR